MNQEVTSERDALQTKLRRLEHEMEDIKSSGSHGDSELIQLRSQVHDLERKLTEAEDEICDLQQEAHDLEMAKLKSQLELDKIKQRNQKDLDQVERDLEEQREAAARKGRSYEARIAELDEELHNALQAKRDAERRMIEIRDQAPTRDHDHEREMKSVIKKLRALLTDAQNQLEKSRDQAGQKSQIRALETQLEDVQSSLTSALKSKQSLESELADTQKQLTTACKSKMETEDKLSKLARDKCDAENEKEDLEEEIHELLKRYQSLVSSSQVTAMTVRDQAEQISTLVDTKNKHQDEIDSLSSRISHFESHYVPKDKINVLESKNLEVEQKLDYEKSLRVRFENQTMKYKDQTEKLEDDCSRLQSKIIEEDRKYKQLQSQLSRALESQADVNRRDIEQAQTISNLNSRIELSESEIHQLQTDLKSAQKRADGLKLALEQSTMSDDEDDEFSTDSEDGYS